MAENITIRDIVVGEKDNDDPNYTETKVQRPRFHKNKLDDGYGPLTEGDMIEEIIKRNGFVVRTVNYTVEAPPADGRMIHLVDTMDIVEMNGYG